MHRSSRCTPYLRIDVLHTPLVFSSGSLVWGSPHYSRFHFLFILSWTCRSTWAAYTLYTRINRMSPLNEDQNVNATASLGNKYSWELVQFRTPKILSCHATRRQVSAKQKSRLLGWFGKKQGVMSTNSLFEGTNPSKFICKIQRCSYLCLL